MSHGSHKCLFSLCGTKFQQVTFSPQFTVFIFFLSLYFQVLGHSHSTYRTPYPHEKIKIALSEIICVLPQTQYWKKWERVRDRNLVLVYLDYSSLFLWDSSNILALHAKGISNLNNSVGSICRLPICCVFYFSGECQYQNT